MEKSFFSYLPPDISLHGAGIDQLIYFLHIFMFVLFIGWGLFYIYCLVRFRHKAGRPASYESVKSKVPKYLEVVVILVEVVFLVGMSFPIWARYRNHPPQEADALSIGVISQQFVWNFQYPGPDGKLGRIDAKLVTAENPYGIDPKDPASQDDFISINFLNIPKDKAVIARIGASDVIHSFGVPVLRVKQDAIPGMIIPVWFTATQEGSFDIACSQLCGVGHGMMKGTLLVQSAADFEKWQKEQPKLFAAQQ